MSIRTIVIETVVALIMLWIVVKVTTWMWPQDRWVTLWLTALLAIDFALIISRIRPKGMIK